MPSVLLQKARYNDKILYIKPLGVNESGGEVEICYARYLARLKNL